MNSYWVKKIVGYVVFGFAAVLFVNYLFMLLWNMLIPDLFNGPVLNFYQALGLMVLAKILFGFGGYGKQHEWKSHQNSIDSNKREEWKRKIESKMANMTEDDKLKFKNSMKGWCYGKHSKQTDEVSNEHQSSNNETK